ncbi:MAG: hypothetical protein U1F52_18925 [Burkholderiales bacterium]
MKNVLFFVHGIGRHGAGWSTAADGPVAALDAAMKRYPCFGGQPLSAFVDIVEVRYDDLFDLVLGRWEELADSLGPVAGNFPWLAKVTELLGEVGGNKNLYADFGGDLLLYGGFNLVARAVRLRVASVLAGEALKRHLAAQTPGETFPLFGIVAHSMGTAIAHDALWTLATADFLKDKSTLDASAAPELTAPKTLSDEQRDHFEQVMAGTAAHPDRPMPLPVNTLMLVSNVIPLISRGSGDYLGAVHDGALQCAAFRDVNNKFDPVCNVKRFQVGTRPNGKRIGVDHLHEKNVHGFGHYLGNPLVHMPLLTRMTGAVTPDDLAIAQKEAGENWQGLGGGLAAEVKAKLEALVGSGDIQDLLAKIKALKELAS